MAESLCQPGLFGRDGGSGPGLLSSPRTIYRPEGQRVIASEITEVPVSTPTLIVNADDFGMTEGTNQAIVDAYQTGIVTSTSLLANGYSFDHAVKLARKFPGLGIGVHLTLTEGPAVAAIVPELLGADGLLPLSNQPVVRKLMRSGLPRAAIQREFEAQITKVIDAGINPTHLDGHKYIHLLPGITSIVAALATRFGIQVVRVPHPLLDAISRRDRLAGLVVLRSMAALAHLRVKRAGLHGSDRTLGFVDTGHLNRETIQRLLQPVRPGVSELLCHPAYPGPQLDILLSGGYRWIAGYDFKIETAALSDPALRTSLESAGWLLRSFAILGRSA